MLASPVQVDAVADTPEGHRDHARVRSTHVGHGRGVQERVKGGSVVEPAFGVTTQAGAIGDGPAVHAPTMDRDRMVTKVQIRDNRQTSLGRPRKAAQREGAGAWGHDFDLGNDGSGRPVFLRIVDALADDIRRGVLAPGARLPGTRRLAERLGVHRNTVLAAMRELEKEGLIRTEPARGSFVGEAPAASFAPDPSSQRRPVAFPLPRDETPLPTLPGRADLPLLGGSPDLRELPVAALARAYRRALRDLGHLAYGDPAGVLPLRQAVAEMLARTRGMACTPDELLISRGSQMALDLVARVLLPAGSRVAVESLGYPPAWAALRSAGAELTGVPVDADGMVIEALERRLATQRIDAVYLTPHHQYPSTVMLSGPRRQRLVALARQHRFAIIEDDYDHEFHYEGRPVRPLAAGAGDVVVYLGTLSKVLAPGLRVGWVCAPRPVIDLLLRRRVLVDRQGDLVVERALAELFEDGEVQRHVMRMRRRYLARRDRMAELLERRLGDRVRFSRPSGGMAMWVETPGIDARAWEAAGRARGVHFQAGPRFDLRGRDLPFIRLGYGSLDERQLGTAVGRLVKALGDVEA